jgi:myo-inositol-1(or 4)-monophosphatase
MQVTQQDVDAVIEVAQGAAALAARIRGAGLLAVRGKDSEINLVTEADMASERYIQEALALRYPAVGLWGEESNTMPASDYFWVVDPIDGTSNFAHNLAYYAVNIALQHGDETLLAVTVNPVLGRVYYARPGAGAYLRMSDGQTSRLQVSSVARLRNAFLATGFPYHRDRAADNNLAELGVVLPRCNDVRVLGSAALDIANVADGVLAAFWEGWLNPWDAAPGVLLVREAGGRATDYWGRAWRLRSSSLVASNGQPGIHDALLEGIALARQGVAESLLAM